MNDGKVLPKTFSKTPKQIIEREQRVGHKGILAAGDRMIKNTDDLSQLSAEDRAFERKQR